MVFSWHNEKKRYFRNWCNNLSTAPQYNDNFLFFEMSYIRDFYKIFKASGVAVKPECITIFNDIKLGHKFRYIVYSLTDDLTHIRVLKTAALGKI